MIISVTVLLAMHAELYLSFLVAVSLLAMAVFAIYMALRLPPHKAASVPQAAPTVFPAAQSVPYQPQPISESIAEALKQTDENLKKRIIKLATKVIRKHHTCCSENMFHLLSQDKACMHILCRVAYCSVVWRRVMTSRLFVHAMSWCL